MSTKEVVLFCPDCLAPMKNGTHPNLYTHAKPNPNCAVDSVELNGKQEIRTIFVVDGFEKIALNLNSE
ncbi:MAG: hypothetical protein NWF06_05005 [Candidatus Bathyarchaeota archaeon]|nr:hypothetical protein [Candidatus Bathyarchaeum sp.]